MREGQSCCCCWWNVDCVCLSSPVASSPHTHKHTQIMTSFLFSFAKTLSSTPLYSSSPLSVSPSLAPPLFSNSPPSPSKSQRWHLHPNRREHTQRKKCSSMCLWNACVCVCLSRKTHKVAWRQMSWTLKKKKKNSIKTALHHEFTCVRIKSCLCGT